MSVLPSTGLTPRIAVLIPCYNEALTVAKVVSDFRHELPDADIYVFDNCSTDGTGPIASAAGAIVVREPRQGKGFVVERMLRTVDADYMVMVDGDDTYPAAAVHTLLAPVMDGSADMVVGARLATFQEASFRPLHVFGNRLVRALVNWIGATNLTDILSGYRAFSRRVSRELPATSPGFEVETDMTIQLLYYDFKVLEVQVAYGVRPEGSHSKLNTFRDGARVLWKIFTLLRSAKPLTFFGSVALFFAAGGLGAGTLPILEYTTRPDHFISHVPLAILATGLMLLSCGFLLLGVLLHSMNWRLRELHNVLTRR